jgi:hypothetical protein
MSSNSTFSAENPAHFGATALHNLSIVGRSPDAHFNHLSRNQEAGEKILLPENLVFIGF